MSSIVNSKGFVIHTDTNEVEIGGQKTRLSPKEMGVLQLLNDQRGHTVSRTELLDKVWGGKFPNDQGLTQAISKLRRLFASNPNLSITTIPKKGYLFQSLELEPRYSALRWPKLNPKTMLLLLLLVLLCVLVFVRRIEIRIDKIASTSQESGLVVPR